MAEPTILPDPAPGPPPAPGPVPEPGTREVRCEFCGCKLDRRGRVLERGAKVAAFMDADDTIRELKKQIAAEKEAHETTRRALGEASAKLSKYEGRKFGATL